jgi:hypothetical protein
VIEQDGEVRTYCVLFAGDTISGDELLDAAGISYEDLGTASGSVLCAIEEVGCFDASRFNSCWCECESGGGDCVYWAFFTRRHGEGWVYSARAFDRVDATDGDLHAWKWGEGGPNSAPRPPDVITFESVCGHPPRGGAPPLVTATSLPPGSSPSTPPTPAGGASSPATTETPFSAAPSTSATAGVSVTFVPQPDATPLPPAASAPSDDDGEGAAELVAFAAVAAALIAAIGVAIYWRRSHGG